MKRDGHEVVNDRSTKKTIVRRSKEASHKGKKWYRTVVAILACIAITVVAVSFGHKQVSPGYQKMPVERMSINSTIESSGVLTTGSKYEVVASANGIISEIASSSETVAAGTSIFSLTSEEATEESQIAQQNIDQAEREYNRLLESTNIKATVKGTLAEIYVSNGDPVVTGQSIALIRNSEDLYVKAAFLTNTAQKIAVGQAATVTILGTGEVVKGEVLSISKTNSVYNSNLVREVIITIKNPGKLTNSSTANISIGGYNQVGVATIEYYAETTAVAPSSGVISDLINRGELLDEGAIIAKINSEETAVLIQNAAEAIVSAKSAYSNTERQYVIRAPFDGTLGESLCAVGDFVIAGDKLGTFIDTSCLRMEIYVSEYQVGRVCNGQTVAILCKAVPNVTYSGVVTNVSSIGEVHEGITTYSVIVEVNAPDGLLVGMHANATIETGTANECLAVPNAAITREHTVLVTQDSPSAVNATDVSAPDGCVYVPVEIGVCGLEYTEIKSGLTEADVVVLPEA